MITIEQLERHLSNANVRFERSKNSIVLKIPSEKYNYQTAVCFEVAENHEYVDVVFYAFDFEETTRSVLTLVNEFNRTYRFFSFSVQEDNSLWVKATAIVKENNSIDEVLELVARGCNIMDDIYPDVQRAMWK